MESIKRYGLAAAGLSALVAAILLATGAGSAVAAQISSVFITNTPANPVPVQATGILPVHEQGTATVTGSVGLASAGNTVKTDPANNGVREQNLDASGNIKVHEQGTPTVNLGATEPATRTQRQLLSASTGFATQAFVTGGGSVNTSFVLVEESANTVDFELLNGSRLELELLGPRQADFGGQADWIIPLPQPVPVDEFRVVCDTTGPCNATVTIVGS